jgi:hypothetical protein
LQRWRAEAGAEQPAAGLVELTPPPAPAAPDEGGLRFDASLPAEESRLEPPTGADNGVVISEKVTYRLAQRPGARSDPAEED